MMRVGATLVKAGRGPSQCPTESSISLKFSTTELYCLTDSKTGDSM